MHCHLIVPELILPAGVAEEACAGLALPALETMLGKGSVEAQAVESYEAWLCAIHGIEKQQDWPLAPITLAGDGGNVGEDYWLRADPVHLRVNRDRLILADSSALDLSLADANALTKTLNVYFSIDELAFYPFRPDRWYVRFASAPQLRTVVLAQAIGKSIDALLPAGGDGKRFVSLSNEAQMLLFEHPVNEARESAGLPIINSLWFWGGGYLPASVRRPFARIWANEYLTRSVSLMSGTPIDTLPEAGTAWLSSPVATGECAMILDQLRSAAQYGDIYRWREALQQLERDWFMPLLAALQAGKLKRLSVTALGEGRLCNATVRRSDLWKFWRSARSVAALATN
jgi:hypothetical protein